MSLDPPLVLFSIDRRAASLPLWEKAEGYAINVLSENQKDISNRFARPLSNKWEGARFENGSSDAPVLPGVAAVFDCAPWARHDGGDHMLFIARVKQFRSSADRQPLVFCQGALRNHCSQRNPWRHSGRSTFTTDDWTEET